MYILCMTWKICAIHVSLYSQHGQARNTKSAAPSLFLTILATILAHLLYLQGTKTEWIFLNIRMKHKTIRVFVDRPRTNILKEFRSCQVWAEAQGLTKVLKPGTNHVFNSSAGFTAVSAASQQLWSWGIPQRLVSGLFLPAWGSFTCTKIFTLCVPYGVVNLHEMVGSVWLFRCFPGGISYVPMVLHYISSWA